MDNKTFSEWLNDELKSRDWSQADLARAANVSRTAISNILNDMRQVGPDLAQAIAGAFKIPPETVFRAAGLLPNIPSQRQAAEEILGYKLSELTDEEIDDLLTYIEFIQAKRGRVKNKTREGVAPPEVVKK